MSVKNGPYLTSVQASCQSEDLEKPQHGMFSVCDTLARTPPHKITDELVGLFPLKVLMCNACIVCNIVFHAVHELCISCLGKTTPQTKPNKNVSN